MPANRGGGHHLRWLGRAPQNGYWFAIRAPMRGGDMLDFDRGPEALENALVRLAYAADLTDEQKDLFETLRNELMTAHTNFVADTSDLSPSPDSEQELNLADMLDRRIAMQQAQLDAMTAIQPSFDAFINSLTDEQLNKLRPQRGGRHEQRHGTNARPDANDAAQSDSDAAPQG